MLANLCRNDEDSLIIPTTHILKNKDEEKKHNEVTHISNGEIMDGGR